MARQVLLDTSFVIALENRDDPLHEKAKRLDQELLQERSQIALHWGILLEIGDGYARLRRRAKGISLIQRMLDEGGYHVHPLSEPLVATAWILYRTHSDKEWTLTDCVSFALMRQLKIKEALTADEHFRQAGFTPLLLT